MPTFDDQYWNIGPFCNRRNVVISCDISVTALPLRGVFVIIVETFEGAHK